MSERRVLVLGGGGFAGAVLVPMLRAAGWRVDAPRSTALDLTRAADVIAGVQDLRPSGIVNLAAAQPGVPEDRLRAVNVHGAESVARAAATIGARLVHVASDAGHDGLHAPYADDAPLKPITAYGRAKADGEAAVLGTLPSAVSVRTTLLWDPGQVDRGTAGFRARLEAGEECRGFTDEIRCPLPRVVLAECLAALLSHEYSGPLNVAGSEALSRYDFATLLLRHFGVRGVDRVKRVRAADLEAAGAPPRPRDLRLRVERVEGLLRRRMPGVRELLTLTT